MPEIIEPIKRPVANARASILMSMIEAAAKLKADSFTIDKELVCVDDKGIADFPKLHSRCFDGEVFLYGFELLELDGDNWRPRTLTERKEKLATILRRVPHGIRFCEHYDGDAEALFQAACRIDPTKIMSYLPRGDAGGCHKYWYHPSARAMRRNIPRRQTKG